MSSVTKSARAIPRCKGCGQPTKGHSGPTGIIKCQNKKHDGDINQNADAVNQNPGTSKVKPVKVLQTDSTKLEILTEVEGAQENDETIPFDDSVLHRKIDECIATLSLEDEATETDMEKKIESGQINSENFLSQSTLEDLESLLKEDEKQLLSKRVAAVRVESSSDSDVDIRKVVGDNSFLLCECVSVTSAGACVCSGLLSFNGRLEGEIFNVFMDPLAEEETDFLPKVGSSKSLWEENKPNEITLSVDAVSSNLSTYEGEDAVSSNLSTYEGEMTMKAFRCVEIIKGKKVMSVEVEASIDFSVIFTNSDAEKDCRLPMVFNKKFKLLEVPRIDDDSTGETSKAVGKDLSDISDKKSFTSEDENETYSEIADEIDSNNAESDAFYETIDEEEDDVGEGHPETENELDEDNISDDGDEAEPEKTCNESINEDDSESIDAEEDLSDEELDEEVRSDEDESEETSWIEESLDSDMDSIYESEV